MALSHFIVSTPVSRGPFMWSLPTEEPYSTGDIIHSATRIARHIEGLPGYAPGRHVALRMPASAECAASILGCWFARAIPASINGAALPAETEHCTQMVDPMAILHLPSVPYPVDIAPDCKRLDATSLLERLSEGSSLPEVPDIDGELDAIILFTSGSTGLPKGVRISHKGLAHSLRGLESAIALKSETFLLQVPMHHVFGVVTFLLAYTTGSRVVSLQDFRADALLDAIKRFGVTIGFGPPEMFLALAHHPRLNQYNIESFSRLLLEEAPAASRRFSK